MGMSSLVCLSTLHQSKLAAGTFRCLTSGVWSRAMEVLFVIFESGCILGCLDGFAVAVGR